MNELRVSPRTELPNPYWSLFCIFVIWKVCLIGGALFSPGIGYDTSTKLLFDMNTDQSEGTDLSRNTYQSFISAVLQKLVRWDAIYYISIAKHGCQSEQEWAFGGGFARLVGSISRVCSSSDSFLAESAVAVLVANVSHLFSVLILFRLNKHLLEGHNPDNKAFIAATLHIIAPAGLFLSAPYSESLFSCLNLLGSLLYACSLTSSSGLASRTLSDDLLLISSGLIFGAASSVRSNGLLSGVMFAWDLALCLTEPLRFALTLPGVRYVLSLVIAGSLVGGGFAIPQTVAYMSYCTKRASLNDKRPWCQSFPPSIYTFVQKHYWNVGFLNYWTISNLPLFALALPMLLALLMSAKEALLSTTSETKSKPQRSQPSSDSRLAPAQCMFRLALPQALLGMLALTNYHIQVVTRLATAYPVIYIWLATGITERHKFTMFGRTLDVSKMTIGWMVMYAIIQGGLFSSFLPPA